jgi:hypothetical protein
MLSMGRGDKEVPHTVRVDVTCRDHGSTEVIVVRVPENLPEQGPIDPGVDAHGTHEGGILEVVGLKGNADGKVPMPVLVEITQAADRVDGTFVTRVPRVAVEDLTRRTGKYQCLARRRCTDAILIMTRRCDQDVGDPVRVDVSSTGGSMTQPIPGVASDLMDQSLLSPCERGKREKEQSK